MIELKKERLDQILHKETADNEELTTILRGIYTRYMRLYERYFKDIDALDDGQIAKLLEYHEETKSLIKYYYLDIPLDICTELSEFDKKYSDNLLGPGWQAYLLENYAEFREKNGDTEKTEKERKAEFSEQVLKAFYEAMDYVFREEFGTGSQTVQKVMSGIAELLVGKE